MAIIEEPTRLVDIMEFSTIGAEDSLSEAKVRLESVDALIVWGTELILGVLTLDHLSRNGNCGSACELDILVDPSPQQCKKWLPRYIVTTESGEPVLLSHGP
jgi:hypothetical protein